MAKKIYLLFLFFWGFASPLAAMSIADVAGLTTQLNHINTQMNAIKRAWNIERIHIRTAEKASPSMYAQIKSIVERIIASDDFVAQMNTIVDMQFNAIVNNNALFRDIKTDNNLSDLFPNLKMSDYGLKLYKAMANKAYFLLLGQKLAEKAREIGTSIRQNQLENARQSIF